MSARAALWLALALLLPGCALLPGGDAAATDAAATSAGPSGTESAAVDAPAFDIRVDCADADLRQLVDRFNSLQRYRAVSDLDAFELERLMALAERDTRELLGTEGYFAPRVQVRREGAAGARPTVVIAIEPGPATTVRQVELDFAGDIAHDPDADAQAQRAAITEGWSLPADRRFTQQR